MCAKLTELFLIHFGSCHLLGAELLCVNYFDILVMLWQNCSCGSQPQFIHSRMNVSQGTGGEYKNLLGKHMITIKSKNYSWVIDLIMSLNWCISLFLSIKENLSQSQMSLLCTHIVWILNAYWTRLKVHIFLRDWHLFLFCLVWRVQGYPRHLEKLIEGGTKVSSFNFL